MEYSGNRKLRPFLDLERSVGQAILPAAAFQAAFSSIRESAHPAGGPSLFIV
jgi:hypothetical protein